MKPSKDELSKLAIAETKLLYGESGKLTVSELVALVMCNSKLSDKYIDLGEKLSSVFASLDELSVQNINSLIKHSGISKREAASLAAAFELGKRVNWARKSEVEIIRTNKDVESLLTPLFKGVMQEEFWTVYLTGTHRVIEKVKICSGNISSTTVDIKLILKRGIENLCSVLIVAHNHPSGDMTPSDTDIELTAKIKQAAALIDIRLLDHVIIGDNCSVSFHEKGIL